MLARDRERKRARARRVRFSCFYSGKRQLKILELQDDEMFWLNSIDRTFKAALAVVRRRRRRRQRPQQTSPRKSFIIKSFRTNNRTIIPLLACILIQILIQISIIHKFTSNLNVVKCLSLQTTPTTTTTWPQKHDNLQYRTTIVQIVRRSAEGDKKAQNLLLVQAGEAPEFTEPIGNHTVAVGRDAQLSCKISNLSNYRTAWLRVEDKGILTIHNNVITRNYRFGLQNNENERNFVLTIKNVQPSDKGGYMCQINSVPMKYAIGYLDVLTPPVFDDAPASSAAMTLSGGGADSSYSATAATTTEATTSLTSGSGGGDDKPANSSQTTVVEGSPATLTCRASGHPSPSITWRREDGRPILLNGLTSASNDEGVPLEIKDTSALSFKSVNRLNSGAYLCIASNGVQPSASKRQLLDVQFAPIVTLPQVDVAATLNQRESRLECIVELNPLGSYHWIKLATSTTNTDRRPMALNQEDDLWLIEHDELIQSDKFDIVIKQINSEKVHMTLTIRRIEKHDFSWYKCIAKNSLGLQSNFIRFYESSVPANTLGSLAPSSSSSSSSFSLHNIFRGGGGNNNNKQQQDDNNKLNLPQNDDASRHDGQQQQQHNNAPHLQQGRAHLRSSSWIQRSTGSTASSTAVSSSATSTRTAVSSSSPLLLLPLLVLVLLKIIQISVTLASDLLTFIYCRLVNLLDYLFAINNNNNNNNNNNAAKIVNPSSLSSIINTAPYLIVSTLLASVPCLLILISQLLPLLLPPSSQSAQQATRRATSALLLLKT